MMNIWLETKNIPKYTWQHLGSKMWHLRDYVMMRQDWKGLCSDVTVPLCGQQTAGLTVSCREHD